MNEVISAGLEIEPFFDGFDDGSTSGAFVRTHDISAEAFIAALEAASLDWKMLIEPEDIENLDPSQVKRSYQYDKDDALNEEVHYIPCDAAAPGAYPVTIVRWG